MRSTENVRGEWDELGERDARVIVPGPGDAPGEVPGVFVTEVPGAAAAGSVEAGPHAVAVREPEGEPSEEAEIPKEAPPKPHAAGTGPTGARAAGAGPTGARAAGAGPTGAGSTEAEPPAVEPAEAAEPAEAEPFVTEALAVEPFAVRPFVTEAPAVEPFAVRPFVTEALAVEPFAVRPFVTEALVRGLPQDMPRAEEPALREETEDIPPDLGPALDAVAEVGRAAVPARDFPLVGLEPAPAVVTGDGRAEESAEERGSEPDSVAGLRKRLPVDEERAPVTVGVGAADPVAWWGAGRRQPVITTETTAPIPVHLLFRDAAGDGTGGPAAPGGTAPGGASPAGTGTPFPRRPGARRPPMPRSPEEQASTRPAPLADPRLTERPGPVLPGWTALLTAAAGTAAGLAVLGWQGALPAAVTGRLGLGTRAYDGIGTGAWALLALLLTLVLLALGGLGRGRAGHASVLTLFGDYRGSVRRTGLLWISPLLLRRRVDVRLRHWRSEPLPAVDANGTALRAVVLVVWRVKDTARATLGVADHERYLRDQVEAALARVLSQLPADAFHEDTRTLRDAETVGNALTRMLKADCVPVGIEVYSAQPTGIEYAPEVAAAMQRCRVAALDAKHRDGVLTSVVDAVDDTVGRLTARGIVELDAYEHKALVRDLTVAFYTGRGGGEGA
ncbi:SPFH domain-containing protein [Streptomyces sp. NPDC005494]|uniref:SPFH domain-containing protein n=1 Tax=Streptomyces sp. NPDC005494 TaxID=3364715 RepID=UPI0036975A64